MVEEKEESKRTTVLIFAGAFIIAGIILYAAWWQVSQKNAPKVETVEYNGFVFEHIEGMWYTKWLKNENIYTVPLRFNPYQVNNVTIFGEISSSFNRPQMYVAFDPTQGNFSYLALAAGELSLSMARALNVKPLAACTVNDSACADRLVVTCPYPNATVILLENEGDPAIWLKGDCISVRGSGLELLRSVDRLLYAWYGIMK